MFIEWLFGYYENMCGIWGYYQANPATDTTHKIIPVLRKLLLSSEDRGKDATGLAVSTSTKIIVYRSPVRARDFVSGGAYQQLFNQYVTEPFTAVIGHTRLATNGVQLDPGNNQPVISPHLIGVHNGIVTNVDQLWRQLRRGQSPPALDSQVLIEYVDHHSTKLGLVPAVAKTFRAMEGSASVALLPTDQNSLILATNIGSLYLTYVAAWDSYFFASEKTFLTDLGEGRITQVKPGNGIVIAVGKEPRAFQFVKKPLHHRRQKIIDSAKSVIDVTNRFHLPLRPRVLTLNSVTNDPEKLRRHDFNYPAINAIQRCTKCILPATTPFISFNAAGVCSYCQEHEKIIYRGQKTLLEQIAPFRKNNGQPDCLVAFSGGRDSSYGLHLIKQELGLNPIAFTYDWGMITDLGRRNQARVLGKLGVEQILVSADIATKRYYIRENVLAWMKKPDLGMVPLFMEGDKQCEYYADQVMKKYDLQLMFFCRGNELEREEFKAGHCGVREADPQGVIHRLAWSGKLKLAWYYGRQYVQNPAYINHSLLDTAFAYYSTYLQPHNYVYLWHYLPWREDQITKTLIQTYDWETDPETTATWRIGDASPAFYNYIYYMVQGFTENDSFRARQVREGVLDRTTALKLVQSENKPRYRALKWYFDRLGLDAHAVLTVVDRMPKLYQE